MPVPLVTPAKRKRSRWVRNIGSVVVALGLVATACTNGDTTTASLDSPDQSSTTTATASTENRSSDEVSASAQSSGRDNNTVLSSNDNGNFVERPVGDSPYWTGSTTSTSGSTPQSASSASTTGGSAPASSASSTPDTTQSRSQSTQTQSQSTQGRSQSTQTQSLGTSPKSLAYTERTFEVPDKSYVATVIGDGVSSLTAAAPGEAKHWFPSPTQFGGVRVFQILDNTTSDDYVKVSLPIRPNGQEGWIPRDSITISEIYHYAVVDLGNDALTVWEGDNIIVQTKVVTGKASTPTPVGQFFVRDIIKKEYTGGAYGPYILALSGFSEVLETFGGGLPAIALHGTNKPGLIGGEYSSGCIRLPNDLIQILAKSVPLGTPVTIVN